VPASRPRVAVVCALLVSSFVPAAGASAQEPDRSRLEAVADSMAAAALAQPVTPGVSVAVARSGEIVFARGYGHADVELDVPASPRTVYRIGSITKQFTAALVMRLVEAGRLSLDDPLSRFLPDFPRGGEVTVRHLLNHTSGIKSYTGLDEANWATIFRHDLTHDELIDLFDELPFDFEPGAEYRYNNSAYYLLGVVLERAAGEPYAEQVEGLAGDLGLDRTEYCGNAEIIRGRAEGYRYEDGALRNAAFLSMEVPGAAGALCSTVLDLVRWTHLLTTGRVVEPSSFEEMTTPAVLTTGDTTAYGYGLGLGELEGHRKISHGGGINGFTSAMAHYPDRDLTIAVLTNAEGGQPARIEEALARTALGLPLLVVKDLPLTDEERSRYVGTYELPDVDLELRVFVDGEQLMARAEGQSAFRLKYQGDDVFIASFDDRSRLVFDVEGDTATGFVLEQGGATLQARRMD